MKLKFDKSKKATLTYRAEDSAFYLIPVDYFGGKDVYNLLVESYIPETFGIIGRECPLNQCEKLIEYYLKTQANINDTYFEGIYRSVEDEKKKKSKPRKKAKK